MNQEKTDRFAQWIWRNSGVVLWSLLVTLSVSVVTLFLPLTYDQGTFLYLGRLWRDGFPPFINGMDTKPVGIYFFYALADAIFGQHTYSYRLFEISVVTLSIYLFRSLFHLLRIRGALLAHFLFAFIYFMGNDFNTIGQAEFLIGFLALTYATLFIRLLNDKRSEAEISDTTNLSRKSGPERPVLFAAGLILGVMALLKQNYLLCGGIFLVYYYLYYQKLFYIETDRLISAGLFMAGLMLPLVSLAIYYLYYDGIYDLYYGMIRLPLLYAKYLRLPAVPVFGYLPLLGYNLFFVLLFSLGIYSALRKKDDRHYLLLSAFGIVLLSVLVQRKLWVYHLISTLPFIAVYTAIGLSELRQLLQRRVNGAAILAIFTPIFIIEFVLMGANLYKTQDHRPAPSNQYFGQVKNTVLYFQGRLNIVEYYRTFKGPYTHPSNDYLLAKKLHRLVSENETVQLFEYCPPIYIYANRRATHKYFFGTIPLMIGGEDSKRMLDEYYELTYIKRRPDWVVFGLDGPWKSSLVQRYNPEAHGYRKMAEFRREYLAGVSPDSTRMGIFKNTRQKKRDRAIPAALLRKGSEKRAMGKNPDSR